MAATRPTYVKRPARDAINSELHKLDAKHEPDMFSCAGHLMKLNTKGSYQKRMFKIKGPFFMYWPKLWNWFTL